jgi:hypothetical protein
MTLIELLIVMSIIVVLASLVVSAVFTVRDAQMKSFAETLTTKLSVGVEQQVRQATDQIREEPVPAWAMTMAGNDQRIAKVIYLKARLKQEFPVSFYQAMYPNAGFRQGQSGSYLTAGGANDLPPKPSYVKALGAAAPAIGANPTPDAATGVNGLEASILLYLWLSQGRRGQAGFNVDEHVEASAIKTVQINGVTFKYFADSWGGPVRAWTFPFGNDELNAPPYQNAMAQNQQSPDPQDPDKAFIAFATLPGSTAFTAMVHPPIHPVTKDLRNLVTVVGSAGRDTTFGVDYFDMTPDGTPDSNDNIYSYRLRRVGRRGD